MNKSGGGKWSGTFQWWDSYPPGEVKVLSVAQLGDYESTYTHMFNYLREKGWVREDKRWHSPNRNRSFDKISEAYDYQVCFLEVLDK